MSVNIIISTETIWMYVCGLCENAVGNHFALGVRRCGACCSKSRITAEPSPVPQWVYRAWEELNEYGVSGAPPPNTGRAKAPRVHPFHLVKVLPESPGEKD